MKKNLLFCFLVFCVFSGVAQSLVPSVSTTLSGTTVTFTGSSETISSHLDPNGISYTPIDNTTTAPIANLESNVSLTSMSGITPFNGSTSPIQHTKFTAIALNHYPSGPSITAKFAFKVFYLDPNGIRTSTTPTEIFVTLTIQGFGSAARTGNFTKSNCPTDFSGTTVSYTLPVNSVYGDSQAHADAAGLTLFAANGQAKANSQGTCTQTTFWNVEVDQAWQRNNCAAGLTGGFYTVVVPAHTYSASSQSAANAMATSYASNNGQTLANSHANCTLQRSYTFAMFSTNSTITDFNITANGVNISGPRAVNSAAGEVDVTNTNVIIDANSTIVVQVTFGYMPTSATIYGSFAPINGVISGSNITFSGVNLTSGSSAQIHFN